VLPGWVKTNMNMRIASKMPSHTASQVILDTISAALLPVVSGRMVFSVGRSELIAQSPYISDDEIARAVSLSQRYPAPQSIEFDPQADEQPAAADMQYTQDSQEFNREQLLDIALGLGGKLSRTHIKNKIGTDIITEGKLREMIESIIEEATAAGKIVTHRGTQYRLKRDKRLYLLVAIGKSEQPTDDTDTEEFTPIIDPIEVTA
jgi:DNA segregation ATPase FtsK/SpoIIIE-like protein